MSFCCEKPGSVILSEAKDLKTARFFASLRMTAAWRRLPQQKLMRIRWLLPIGLALLLGCGRGSELQRMTVSGKVLYRGQPVADGTVVFVPVKGTKGPAASATIEDGDYKVAVGGGVPAGTHRVEIQAFHPVAASPNRPPSMRELPTKQQYLPKQYNRESTLEVTVRHHEGQTQDFDLK